MRVTRSGSIVRASADAERLRGRILKVLAQNDRDGSPLSTVQASDFDARQPSLADSALQDLAIGGFVRFAERDPAWGGNSVYRNLRLTPAGRARLRA